MGKSQLILEFVRGKQALYFLGKQAPAKFQLHAWMETVARAFDKPSLATLVAEDWRTAMRIAVEQKHPDHVKEVRARAERFPNPTNLTIQPRIFTRKPIPIPTGSRPDGILWHCLEDLYREHRPATI